MYTYIYISIDEGTSSGLQNVIGNSLDTYSRLQEKYGGGSEVVEGVYDWIKV